MFPQEEEARGKMITAPYEGSDGGSALSAAQKWNNIHTNSAKRFAGRRRARRGRSVSPPAAVKAWYKEIEKKPVGGDGSHSSSLNRREKYKRGKKNSHLQPWNF